MPNAKETAPCVPSETKDGKIVTAHLNPEEALVAGRKVRVLRITHSIFTAARLENWFDSIFERFSK